VRAQELAQVSIYDKTLSVLVTDIPLRREFMGERFTRLYECFLRFSRSVLIPVILAVVITNMGLFCIARRCPGDAVVTNDFPVCGMQFLAARQWLSVILWIVGDPRGQ
jgi:hypothetical protein